MRAALLLEVIHFALAGDAVIDFTSATSAYVIRPGWSFKVEVFGSNFDYINDKILLVPTGIACGDPATPPRGKYSTVADYYSLVCDGQSSAAGRLVCEDLSVYQAGTYTICVCDATAMHRPGPPSSGGPAAGNSTADDGSAVTTTTMTSTSTATSLPCITAERFWLGSDSTGTVTVNGPRNEGTLIERAGTPFRLILQGTSLSSRDRIRITDGSTDCFDLGASKPMHPAVATDFPYEDPSGQRRSGSASQEIWENIGVTVPGTYQVCWCSAGGTVSNSCSDDQEFTTNVATLEVGGPTAGVIQSFACITGVACTLEMTGSGLNNNDRIITIADHLECGFAPQSSAVVSGGDFASPRTSGSDTLSRFGGIIMGRHGDFKACWCGSYDEIQCPTCCTQMEEYTVYAGNVTSGGPNQGQIDRPPIGVPFAYTITGWGMSSNDRIRIVDQSVRCGRAGAETHSLGIEASTVPNGPPTYTEGSDPANRTSASWTDIVAREMRSYRVCWCAHFFMGCIDGAHFALDIGIINPRGASNSTYINAIPGRPFSLTVTAATGSYLTADDRIRIVRSEVSDGRCGGFGTAEHSPAVAALACWPTCIDSPVWGAPEMGPDNESQSWDPVLIMESGTYNICWCNSGQGGCDSDEDFSFRAGMIMANGVNIGEHWHCAAYFPCTVEIQMSDGLASGDYLQLVAAAPGARCGVDSRAAATSFTRGTRISGYEGRDTTGQDVVLFEFGSPQAPGIYLACYCQGSICRTSSVTDLDFFQQAGQVTVMGLQGRDDYHKCYLRGACRLNIRGAGLDVQDAVMLLDPMDNCGQTGSPVSFSLDGPRFFTAGGDRLFIGNLTSTSNEGLESWTFDLGTPIRTGRHRLCYCSRHRASSGMCENRADFDQAAGELFVRGSEFNSELRCEQGESCQITARGAQFDALDRMVLLKDGVGHYCGMVNAGQYPSWAVAMTPENIQPDAIIPDLWAATWIISSVREPGTYRICYCAYIIGGTLCVEPGQSTPYERYRHELGTVRVTGSILAVRQVGVTPGYWQPKLPAAKYAVSVEVDVLNTFMKYTCVATTRPAPDNFIPRKSDLENCTKDVEELNDRQRFFPRCWGIGTTVETVIDMGPNLVHVPTHIPDITLESSTEMHVWCYGRDLCSNDRCVMPADNVGLAVPITGGLVSYSTNWAATVSTPFALRVPLASDFDIGDPWPRMKIITHESACDSTQLHRSVMGITCLESGVGMCEPAPISTLSSGSWGSGRELIWTGVAVTRADRFTVCYCDRHYASTCVGWISIGTLQVSGPQNAGNMRFVVNPGVPGTVTINGIGLATEDRIRIIPQNVGCMVVSMPTTTTPSTRRLQAGIDFRSGSALSANGSHEEWEVLISVEGTYNVCWCGGTESSCSEADDYTVYLGTLSVATKRDCEVTDWWVVTDCDKQCGGGEVKMRRGILQEATGGGQACPSQAELVKTEQCNMNPCPLARLDRLTTSPETIYAGSPFVMTIQGEWFDPDSDRILIINQDETCGQTQAHHGGASCNQFGASGFALVCGNGDFSVRLQRPGWYRVCVCDASASIQRSADGSTNITTGAVESAGIMATNCDSPSHYILSPPEGAVLEVFEAPIPQEGPQTGNEEGLSTGVTVAILAGGLFTFVVLALVSAYWVRKKFFSFKPSQVANSSMASKEGKEGLQAGVDPHMLQYYESYYQSLGYPPGTATQMLGGAGANQQQHQMALPAPMMPGAMMQAAPAGTPALQDSAWMQPRPMGLPLALPPSRHPGMMAPPTPQNRGRSPRGNETGKSFGDLVSETNRRPSRQLPLFTDTSLPRMPTPTATPRGVATPRAGEDATLALEDGNTEEAAAGEEVTVTVSKSLEDVKEHRPSTADSVLSCLSESTAGSGSRPGTGDTAKPSDAEGKPLSPVKEEREEEEGNKDSQTPRSFRTFFNDRVTKLLSNKEGTEPDRKLFGASFSGFFGGGGETGDASVAASKEVPAEAGTESAPEESSAPATSSEAEEKRAEEERLAQEAAAREAAERAAEEERLAAAKAAAAQKAEEERLAEEAAAREAAAREAAAREAAEKAAEEERLAAERAASAQKAEEEAAAREAAAREAAERAAEEERLAAARAAAAQKAEEEAAAREAAERAAEEERLAAARAAAAQKAEEERLAQEAAAREAAAKAAEEERLAAARAAAEKAEAERLAEEAAAREAAEKVEEERLAALKAQGVSPRTGKAPPPPPPKAGAEASRSGSKSSTKEGGERRPPPPPPKGKPSSRPGPQILSVDTDPEANIGSGSASPAGWQRADHSLAMLWQSQQQTPTGSAAPSPLASMANPDDTQARAESPAGSAPNTDRMMSRPPRGPGPMMPGPGLNVETDFEDTLKSNASFTSDSPSNRRTHSLGGLAAASANVVAADKKAGKVGTPQHSARSTASRPIRANVPTRSPRQEQIQAQDKLLGHTLPPQ